MSNLKIVSNVSVGFIHAGPTCGKSFLASKMPEVFYDPEDHASDLTEAEQAAVSRKPWRHEGDGWQDDMNAMLDGYAYLVIVRLIKYPKTIVVSNWVKYMRFADHFPNARYLATVFRQPSDIAFRSRVRAAADPSKSKVSLECASKWYYHWVEASRKYPWTHANHYVLKRHENLSDVIGRFVSIKFHYNE